MSESEASKDLDLEWGCEAIAKAIRQPKRRTFYLLENGMLAKAGAKKIRGRWVVERAKLRQLFLEEAP